MRFLLWVLLLGGGSFPTWLVAAEPEQQVVATVDGAEISLDEYRYFVGKTIRERFYHGSIPEAELQTYHRELLEQLVDSYLLSAEALRQGIGGEQSADPGLSATESADSSGELFNRLAVAARVRKELEDQLKLKIMEQASPSDEQLQRYYEANLDKFMRPEQNDVSVIVLGVDPAAGGKAWEQARQKALDLKLEIEAGGSFEELAEIHSADVTASAGGAMGLLHRGLLADGVEVVLKDLAAGDLSEPQVLLVGVALFRLNERIEAEQLSLDEVRSRAAGLLKREQGELAWEALGFRLRNQAVIVFDESLLKKVGI